MSGQSFCKLAGAFAGLFLAGAAAAYVPTTGAGAGSGPTYTGPGDVVSGATAWYGLRAYSAAVAATGTQSVVDLRRASDNATCTAKIASDGSVDLTVGTPCNSNTQTVTAWIGASSALVSKIYDQTGNGKDVAQATAANQPQLSLSPVYLIGNGTSTGLTVTGLAQTQPWSTSGVSEFINGVTATGDIALSGSSLIGAFLTNTQAGIFTGSANATASAAGGAFYSVQTIGNGASSLAVVNGSAGSTANSGSSNYVSGNTYSLMNGGSNNWLNGYFRQSGVWAGSFSSGQYSAMSANDRAFWGF